MSKKIILSLLYIAFSGLLIFGGINRTLAKSGTTSTGNNGSSNQNWSTSHNHEEDGEIDFHSGQYSNQSNITAQGNGQGNGNGRQGQGNKSYDTEEIEALYLALDAEYHSLAVYQYAIDTFGSVEPFTEIIHSKENHINALINQLTKGGLSVPENSRLGQPPSFGSIQQACQFGAQLENEHMALYEQLINRTDENSLIQVFSNLYNTAKDKHIPELEACQ